MMRVAADKNTSLTVTRYLEELGREVRRSLEHNYKININTAEQMMRSYYSTDYLPLWYFLSNGPCEIAGHFVIISQLLDANREHCTEESCDGSTITYFLNVGRENPGRLEKIIVQNSRMGIGSFDSVKTKSGLRIISIEKRVRKHLLPEMEGRGGAFESILQEMQQYAEREGCVHAGEFFRCLNHDYLREEMNNPLSPRRIQRHLRVFEDTVSDGRSVVRIEDTTGETDRDRLESGELRITAGIMDADERSIITVLDCMKCRNISLNRSYYDLFAGADVSWSVGIVSLYVPRGTEIDGLHDDLRQALEKLPQGNSMRNQPVAKIEQRLEDLVRDLSDAALSNEHLHQWLESLRELIRINTDCTVDEEINDFLLNCFSDFMAGLAFLELDGNNAIVHCLLRFDHFGEFFVASRKGGESFNSPGFRVKHNCVRGKAYKGGLRVDPIVKFVEVAALAFMMTWKCARSRILFGGGKGGLLIDPKDFDDTVDYFDTLASFGRSIFLVTGPTHDVPAGDVGCGPAEIGDMFEGFKSALRDIALLASGMRTGLSTIGNHVISVERAREILSDHFNIDYCDMRLLHELVTNERYLELVATPQITGKPKMGIAARTGATGRGLCYAILAMVGKLYLKGEWRAVEPPSSDELALLSKVASIKESTIIDKNGTNLIDEDEWRVLETKVYPKLLRDKKVVVQGSGKVGGSILRELAAYGVNVIAVLDAGGALIGDHLDVEELLAAVRDSGDNTEKSLRYSVMGARKNVRRKIFGAVNGMEALELECDILVPAAIENVISIQNAGAVRAKMIACGSNGPNTAKAELTLQKRGIAVLYDFLANQGGVNASYFEWLRNITDRLKYEAEYIYESEFDPCVLDEYIMPEFRERIKKILAMDESHITTLEWNRILRDISIAAVNEDYDFSVRHAISMKTAGYVNAQLRVLAAHLLTINEQERGSLWDGMGPRARSLIRPFLEHPEAEMHNPMVAEIAQTLYSRQ
jgi:glutamate dehydrogenase (NAD(P)+)